MPGVQTGKWGKLFAALCWRLPGPSLGRQSSSVPKFSWAPGLCSNAVCCIGLQANVCRLYDVSWWLLYVVGSWCLLDFVVFDVCVLVSFLVLVAVVVFCDFKQQWWRIFWPEGHFIDWLLWPRSLHFPTMLVCWVSANVYNYDYPNYPN